MDIARRSFLRGRAKPTSQAFRPPWSGSEDAFTSACTRCGDCLSACPTQLLQAGPGGFPVADFSRGFCTFCGDCAQACEPHAIAAKPVIDAQLSAWTIRVDLSDACLTRQQVICRSCGETCEYSAIRFVPRVGGVALAELDAARCTGCGECISACPTQAIRPLRPSDIPTVELTT